MPDKTKSNVNDPNYKWRVIGALGLIFSTVTGIVLAVIFSHALTASTIVGLFGMQFAISLVTILLVLRYPSENPSKFSMDNPWIAVPFSTLAGILASLFVNWISR